MRGIVLPILVTAVLSVTILCFGAESEREQIETDEQSEPVLHYTFDSRTGEVVANQVGREHSGQSNKASFTNSFSDGTALIVRKDKVQSGYVETADHKDVNAPTFTVAAWIKLRRKHSHGSVVCKHDWTSGTARGYVLRCNTDGWGTSTSKTGSPSFVNFTIGAGGWISVSGTTPVPANQWVHVAGTFDGTHLRAFVNGRLEGTTEVKQAYTPSPLPLRIGHAAFALEKKRKFDGRIDDVMMWKRALSEKELHAIFDDQKKSRPRPLTAEDISPLIKKLGSEKFKDREEAQRQLIELDTEVLPLLKSHRQIDEPEVVWRLKQIEKAIDRNLRK